MQMELLPLLTASLRKRSSNYYAYGTEDLWREENRVGIDLFFEASKPHKTFLPSPGPSAPTTAQ